MRITWSEESAGQVTAGLKKMREQMATSLSRSRQVQATLEEANPGGENKRLNALGKALEDCVARLKQAEEDAGRMLSGVRVMIDTFEETEREAVRLLANMDGSRSAEVYGASAGGSAAGAGSMGTAELEKESVLGPHTTVGDLGPVPGWLHKRMEEYRQTQTEGGLTWQSLL